MSLAPLRAALSAVRQALREPDLIRADEDLTFELPTTDAGFRFEAWLANNVPAGMTVHDPNFVRTIHRAGDAAWREVRLDGVRFKWPVRIADALPSGGTTPRPLAGSPFQRSIDGAELREILTNGQKF